MFEQREQKITAWFHMWLRKEDPDGIDALFSSDCTYVESWGPIYEGRQAVKHWFREWNTRGAVTLWDIKQFFHKGDQTVVEWHFENTMHGKCDECFDGVSLLQWDETGAICFLKEFGCKLPHYNPYPKGSAPDLRNVKM